MVHPHSNMIRQVDNVEGNISSLAAQTGLQIPGKIDAARLNGFRTLKQSGIIQLEGTAEASPTGGPIMVGFHAPDMSLAELEEAIENDPQSSADPLNEQARRAYFVLGYLQTSGSGTGSNRTFSKRFQWSYIEGTSLAYFAYNTDLTTAIPATSQIKIFCEHLGVWLRD